MKIYETFQLFWNDFAQEKPNKHGFNDWTLVKHLHVNDDLYQQQRQAGLDELGFQPFQLTFANPLEKSTKQVLIKGVDNELANRFLHYSRQLYLGQIEARFGSFRPSEFQALTEYDTWESFYETWLERGGKSVLNHHIPLLFDHTNQIEYWTRKQTGLQVLPYQRLLLTTYFAPEDRFFDFFIKNVDDAEIQRIMLLNQSRIGLNLEILYAPPSGRDS
jgi:hypothetical protein